MPFIADTVRLGPADDTPPAPRVFFQAARDAGLRTEEAFRRRQENLDLLTAEADALAERDFGLFRRFVAELQPLGLIEGMGVGPFVLSRNPNGDITRPITLTGQGIGLTSKYLTFNATYVGTSLMHYEVKGTVRVGGVWVRTFDPHDLEEVLVNLATSQAEAATRRKFNETRDTRRRT